MHGAFSLYSPTSSCGEAKDGERVEATAVAACEEPLPERPRQGSAEGFEHG
jgi:hypothetical protein